MCLGDYIAAFNAKWQQDESLGVQKGMLRLLGSLAGVKPLFKVANERGELYPCDVFEDGQTKYLCLLGPMSEKAGGAQAAGAEAQGFGGAKQDSSAIREVELQAPMCVYDILDSNRFLGKVQRFKVTMLPAVGRVLACLPAPVDGLELAPAAKEAAPGDAVEFSCRRLPANGWVALVKVFGPDKAELPWYGQRLYSRGPAMKIVVPTAFNDKPGTYTVEATEAVSGKTARARFTLARPNLLLNGDFEKGASSNLKSSDKYLLGLIKRGWNFGDGPFAELPPDWTPNVGAAKVKVVDAELAHSGSHALRLETSKQGCHLYAQGGKAGRYHVSFWARGQGVLTLCLYCWGKNGQEKTVALAPVKLDDAWRQFDQDFDVKALAADAASFTLAVSLGGNSTLFLDDLRLFENKE